MPLERTHIRYQEIASKASQILEICPIPLTYREIAELIECHPQIIAILKSEGYLKIPKLGKRTINYVKSKIKSSERTRIYRLRAELGVGPVNMYDYAFKAAGKRAFEESPLNETELTDLFFTLRDKTELKVARMILKAKSIEEICQATKLNHETMRKYIGGLGLYSTREAIKEKLGKKKLCSGASKHLPLNYYLTNTIKTIQ